MMLLSLLREDVSVSLCQREKIRGLILKRTTFGALFAALTFNASPVASQSNPFGMLWGKDALEACSHIEDRRSRDATLGLVCVSWVNGAVQGAAHTFTSEPEKPNYCTPGYGGSNGQYAAVFLKYLRDHPEKLHLPAIYVFHQSMAEAFPC